MEKLQEQRDSEAEMHKAFLYFSNGHDRINLADLRKVSLDIPDEQTEQTLHEMLTVADRDGDGVVTFQDFRNMMVQCINHEASDLDNPAKIIADAKGPAGELVSTIAQGFKAMASENWADANDHLTSAMADHARIGGSRAQRDLIEFALAWILLQFGRKDQAQAVIAMHRPSTTPQNAVTGLYG